MKRLLAASAIAMICATSQAPAASICEDLYRARNGLYGAKGWCMRGIVARRMFPDNSATCMFTRWEDVPFSASERNYYRNIIAKEKALGCPVPP